VRPALRFGACYDFRNPPGSVIPTSELYARILDQIAWLDEVGYDQVWFTEHHFVDDGYLPSFVPVAGAVAVRTRRLRISTDITLLPFHNPLRLAEDLAVLDNLSGGRMEVGVGMGYAPHEFTGFGIPRSRRVSLTEEGVEVLQRAFAGGRFSYTGRRYRFTDVRVTPEPVQPGGPPIWMAAMGRPGAERAARFGVNLLPQGAPDQVLDPWRQAMAAAGHDPTARRVGIIRPWLVTDDRERDWPPIREAERYKARIYAAWLSESGDAVSLQLTGAAEPIPQTWVVGDEDTVTRELGDFIDRYGITDVVTWGAPPGVAPERMADSLERFARTVAPRLRERLTNNTAPRLRERLTNNTAPRLRERLTNNTAPRLRERLTNNTAPRLRERLTNDTAPRLRERLTNDTAPRLRERFA
jgi:alkanesulfonate monooxygenase SsuD/methylene tetrahydromethanopterin reductase-like flavin-dependent oxidoreductase (luciferase family)